jgi:two-component system, NarL family, nitrate/nitrite response regulator NarL
MASAHQKRQSAPIVKGDEQSPDDGSSANGTPRERRHQPIRILQVSDLLMMRAGLRLLLEASGLVVAGEASSCEEAVRIAERELPNIILIDLDLAKGSFACFADLTSASHEGRIIALADQNRIQDHPTAIELGAVGLLLKQEPADMLTKAIRKVHEGELWLDRISTADLLRNMTRRRRFEDVEGAKIATLTKREHEVISLIGEGLKNRVIAERLFISEATVRNHLTSILNKLGVSNRSELVVYSFRHKLVPHPETSHRNRAPATAVR